MREAYLVNNSQSTVSIPLYEKVLVTVRGQAVQEVQFRNLVPKQELILGTNLSVEKKLFYKQFSSVLVDLKFRDVKPVSDETKLEEPEADETKPSGVEIEDKKEPEVKYTEEGLLKMRQAELITIAGNLGLEATTQNSKAEITKMILEKVLG